MRGFYERQDIMSIASSYGRMSEEEVTQQVPSYYNEQHLTYSPCQLVAEMEQLVHGLTPAEKKVQKYCANQSF